MILISLLLNDRISMKHNSLSIKVSPIEKDKGFIDWVITKLSWTNHKETTNLTQ
jgi:hypothetical protein